MIRHTAFPLGEEEGKLLIKAHTPYGPTEMIFNCTLDEYKLGVEYVLRGDLIQDAFSFLTAEEREFLISGMTPAMWDEMTSEDEDDWDDDYEEFLEEAEVF